jgi:hypothetical protein
MYREQTEFQRVEYIVLAEDRTDCGFFEHVLNLSIRLKNVRSPRKSVLHAGDIYHVVWTLYDCSYSHIGLYVRTVILSDSYLQ